MAVYNIPLPSDRELFPTLFARQARGENLYEGETARNYRRAIAQSVSDRLVNEESVLSEDDDEDISNAELFRRAMNINSTVHNEAYRNAGYVLQNKDPDSLPPTFIPLFEIWKTTTTTQANRPDKVEYDDSTVGIYARVALFDMYSYGFVDDYINNCGRPSVKAIEQRKKEARRAYRAAKLRNWLRLFVILALMCVATLGVVEHPLAQTIVAATWDRLSAKAQEWVCYGYIAVMLLLLVRFLCGLFRQMDTSLETMSADKVPAYDEDTWFGQTMPEKQADAAKHLSELWHCWRLYCCMTSYAATGRLDRYQPDPKLPIDGQWRAMGQKLKHCRDLLAQGAL